MDEKSGIGTMMETLGGGFPLAVPSMDAPKLRRYLPTLGELIDRLSIVQLKQVFIPEHRDEYRAEREMIEHDIDLILDDLEQRTGYRLSARAIHASMTIMLLNRAIWESESKARAGGDDQDRLLKLSHSLNGQRNAAKNVIAKEVGERLDFKVDAFAAALIKEYGQWMIFEPID